MARKILWTVGGALVLLVLLFIIGPREGVDETIAFDEAAIGDDVTAYLATREGAYGDIKPGAGRQVLWADPATRAQTEFAIVNLHGFSASSQEIRPVPDDVATALGANLYFARLTGHGRSGDAMAEASANDWLNDTAEALAVGRRIGRKLIVIGTSTGGTLAALAAERPELARDIAGIVMISPNFAVQAAGSQVLTLPWARQLLPLAFGETRTWEPKNAEQEKWWSTSYPTVALLPMQAAVDRAAKVRFEEIDIPALFIFHDDDGVVKSAVTREVAARWGGKHEIFAVPDSSDTSKHVIAGAIASPENTKTVTDRIVAWVRGL